MNERQKSIVSSLGQSSLWESFRDEFLRDYIKSVRDVSNNFGNEELFEMIKRDPAAAYLGRIIAGLAIEDLIRIVDNLGGPKKKPEDYR